MGVVRVRVAAIVVHMTTTRMVGLKAALVSGSSSSVLWDQGDGGEGTAATTLTVMHANKSVVGDDKGEVGCTYLCWPPEPWASALYTCWP